MLITRLELNNFGRHTHIAADITAPVVGIIGANGSGKSTVLTALQFAITGETHDTIDSYVRNGDGNASVSLDFIKNGKAGSIFRQLGNTAKRRLTWDGQEFRSAKDVDNTMAEIFGADKKAISSAVFVPQGALNTILFDGDSDRKKMFVQLVNMAFCEQRSKMLDSKIKKIRGTVVDLTEARDVASKAREQSMALLLERQKAFEATQDWQQAIQHVNDHITKHAQLDSYTQQIGIMQCELKEAELSFAAACAEAKIANIAELESIHANLERTIAADQQLLNHSTSVFHALAHYDRLNKDINTGTVRLALMRIELKKWGLDECSIEDSRAKLLVIDKELYKLDYIKKIEAQSVEDRASLILNQDSLDSWRAHEQAQSSDPMLRRERITELMETAAVDAAAMRQMNNFMALRKEIAKCLKPNETECSKCGLTISDPDMLAPDAMVRLQETINALSQKQKENDAARIRLINTWSQVDVAINKLVSNIATLSANLSSSEQKKQDNAVLESESYLQTSKKDLETRIHTLPLLVQQEQLATKDIEAKRVELKSLTLATPHLNNRDAFSASTCHSIELRLNSSKELHKKTVSSLRDLVIKSSTTIALQRQITQTKINHDKLSAEIAGKPSEILAVLLQQIPDALMLRAELAQRQSSRNDMQGQLTAAQLSYKRDCATYFELVQRMAADEAKMTLIKDLVAVQEALSIDGLPMAVVQHHFGHLAVLTQEALVRINANFRIIVDPKQSLSFNFCRIDDDSGVELPMSKLSGGQKVRLCIAFLMAVQRRLVKEVGLLVLDEPSTHCDTEGVESFAELFRSLNSDLQNTEMQIWLVDHNQILETALGNVIRL